MTKPTRKPKPRVNGPAVNGAPSQRPDGPMQVTISVQRQPAQLRAEQVLGLRPPADPALPYLLVHQPDGTWVGVILEAGEWEVRRKAPDRGLWLPGMPS